MSDYEAILDAERRCLAATEAILRLLDAAEPFIPRKGNIASREYKEWCEAAREARAATRFDGEGEKCPTCGGNRREGGTVATAIWPGSYETDDCPDLWHEAKATERKPGPLHG